MNQRNLNATPPPVDAEALELSRRKVRDLLVRSEAFKALPPDQQREIAKHTVEIASYLAAPEGIKANQLPNASGAVAKGDPYAIGLADNPLSVQPIGGRQTNASGSNTDQQGKFTAQGAREGAGVAGALLREVNFPQFVSGLITGVFDAIVNSSIKQMEAYGQLVKSVAQTLNQFRDENVPVNQGRDHLLDSFPDVFELSVETGGFGSQGGERIRLREGVDEDSALQRINQSLPIEGEEITSLDDETIEQQLIPAARTQLATSRQQLLATMVLMGINRIIVTDGKIAAKVMYDFRAQDNFRFQRNTTNMEYDPYLQTTSEHLEGEMTRTGGTTIATSGGTTIRTRGSNYVNGIYAKKNEPVMTVMSVTSETNDANLITKANLAGTVEVNFRSETFPLEKMADSFQIGMIQNAAQKRGLTGARGVGGAGESQPSPNNLSGTTAPPTVPAPAG